MTDGGRGDDKEEEAPRHRLHTIPLDFLSSGNRGTTVARVSTHGDGSCFFHSLVLAFNACDVRSFAPAKRRELGIDFRRMLLREDYWSGYVESLDDVYQNDAPSFDDVSSPRTYAGEYIYNFISEKYCLNILILSHDGDNNDNFLVERIADENAPTVVLIHFVSLEHFEPVVLISEERRRPSRKLVRGLQRTLRLMGCTSKKNLSQLVAHGLGDDNMVGGLFLLTDPLVVYVRERFSRSSS
jgi:hypothetical protein